MHRVQFKQIDRGVTDAATHDRQCSVCTHPITFHTPSRSIPHHVPYPITFHTPSRSIPHHAPYPITLHTPSHSIPHHAPYPITLHTPSRSIPHHAPYPITLHTPSRPPPPSAHMTHNAVSQCKPHHTQHHTKLTPLSASFNAFVCVQKNKNSPQVHVKDKC